MTTTSAAEVLSNLTGLRLDAAAALLRRSNNSFHLALVHTVQSRELLRQHNAFSDERSLEKHGARINDILRATYDCVAAAATATDAEAPHSTETAWTSFASWAARHCDPTSNEAIPLPPPDKFLEAQRETHSQRETDPVPLPPVEATNTQPTEPRETSHNECDAVSLATVQPAQSAFPKADPKVDSKSPFSGGAPQPFQSALPKPTEAGAKADPKVDSKSPFSGGAPQPFQSAFPKSTEAGAKADPKADSKSPFSGGAPQPFQSALPKSTEAVDAKLGAAPVFSFGTQSYPADGSVLPTPAGFGGDRASVTVSRAEPVFLDAAPHDTRCFVDLPCFFEEEVETRAPLFLKDPTNYLNKELPRIRAMTARWSDGIGDFFGAQPVRYVAIDNPDDELIRVIIKDAERTFFGAAHREKLTSFLVAMWTELRSYGQAMSYFAAICLLTLSEQQTAGLIRKVAREYIPGHWAAEAVGFSTNAWLIERVLRRVHPDVMEHLSKLNAWPDTYMQKVLSGLCIQVLPFPLMYEFLDAFLRDGFLFLIRFEVALIGHLRKDLLRVTDAGQINRIYAMLSLDGKSIEPSEMKDILRKAAVGAGPGGVALPDDVTPEWIATARMDVYNDVVAPRLARAGKFNEFEPCVVCDAAKPEWWHDDIGATCTACKERSEETNGWSKY